MTKNHPSPITQTRALEIFSTGSIKDICKTLIAIALNGRLHWDWIQKQCLHFLQHSEPEIRGAAAIALGHTARIHKKLDRELVTRALREHLYDKIISEPIKKALKDIHLYLCLFDGHQEYCVDPDDSDLWPALSTFEDFIKDSLQQPYTDIELEGFFYTTILKWGYCGMDRGHAWCWRVFGPKHGDCDCGSCCPIVLAKGKEHVNEHSHIGLWTSIWLGKTGYEFGYEKFFFKTKEAHNVFEQLIRNV